MSIIRLCSINFFPPDEGSSVPAGERNMNNATSASRQMLPGVQTDTSHETSDRERIVEELRDLLASIDDIGRRIKSLPRPEGLPPPGQPLPPDVCPVVFFLLSLVAVVLVIAAAVVMTQSYVLRPL
jgi:hypothetical protein